MTEPSSKTPLIRQPSPVTRQLPTSQTEPEGGKRWLGASSNTSKKSSSVKFSDNVATSEDAAKAKLKSVHSIEEPVPSSANRGDSDESDSREHLLVLNSTKSLPLHNYAKGASNEPTPSIPGTTVPLVQEQAVGMNQFYPQIGPNNQPLQPPTSVQPRHRISIPGMRNAYGEAGSQPSIAQQQLAAQYSNFNRNNNINSSNGRPIHQHSLSDSLTGEHFYDASPAPLEKMPHNMQQDQVREHETQEHQQTAQVMRNLQMFLQAAGAGAVGTSMSGSASPGQKGGPSSGNRAHSAADNEKTKRSSKTFVEVRIVFLKIGEIDTLKEQYSADVYIQSRWREPLLDRKSPDELKATDLTKFWSPCLYIENALSEQKDSSWQQASLNDRGECYVSERRKLRGVFLENLELQNFPLDVQDLSITVVSERPDCDVELVPDEEDPSSVNIGTFADEQEWKLYQHVEVTKKTVKVEFANQQRQHSAIQVTCRAARRPGYFYYNVFLVMFFISSISFGTFSVDCNLPQNRLQLSFTLLLTSIAFKMVINQSLPKISYLTYMDKYVLMSLVFLVLICVWHSIVPTICADKSPDSFYANRLENFVILGFFLLYIFGHIFFAIFVYIHAWKRRLQMSQKDREFRVRSEFYGAAASKSSHHHIKQSSTAGHISSPQTAAKQPLLSTAAASETINLQGVGGGATSHTRSMQNKA